MQDQKIEEWLLEGQIIITPDGKEYTPHVLVDINTQEIISEPYLRPKNSILRLRSDLMNRGFDFYNSETWRLENQIVTTPDNRKYEIYILVNSQTKKIIKGPFLSEIKNKAQHNNTEDIFNNITKLDQEIREMIETNKTKIDELHNNIN